MEKAIKGVEAISKAKGVRKFKSTFLVFWVQIGVKDVMISIS